MAGPIWLATPGPITRYWVRLYQLGADLRRASMLERAPAILQQWRGDCRGNGRRSTESARRKKRWKRSRRSPSWIWLANTANCSRRSTPSSPSRSRPPTTDRHTMTPRQQILALLVGPDSLTDIEVADTPGCSHVRKVTPIGNWSGRCSRSRSTHLVRHRGRWWCRKTTSQTTHVSTSVATKRDSENRSRANSYWRWPEWIGNRSNRAAVDWNWLEP